MKEIRAGDHTYRLVAAGSGSDWVAHAERVESGERFGVECSGSSETAAIDRLAAWLVWQHEHVSALEALQDAERVYHRTIAGSVFATPAGGPTAIALQREALEPVEAARRRLDEARSRRPE